MTRNILITVAIALASVAPASSQRKGMCDLVSSEKISKIIGTRVTNAEDSPKGGDVHAVGVRRQCLYMVFATAPQYHFDSTHVANVIIAPLPPAVANVETWKTSHAGGATTSGFFEILGRPAFINPEGVQLSLLLATGEELIVGIGIKKEIQSESLSALKDPALRSAMEEIATTFVKSLPGPPPPSK